MRAKTSIDIFEADLHEVLEKAIYERSQDAELVVVVTDTRDLHRIPDDAAIRLNQEEAK